MSTFLSKMHNSRDGTIGTIRLFLIIEYFYAVLSVVQLCVRFLSVRACLQIPSNIHCFIGDIEWNGGADCWGRIVEDAITLILEDFIIWGLDSWGLHLFEFELHWIFEDWQAVDSWGQSNWILEDWFLGIRFWMDWNHEDKLGFWKLRIL